ncbi:hypothetical protein [Salinarimonas sp.]|uniref:hypothetical protein n=1 Tax=Salinarimonas sp. TaxID=2766526 RepID=UPI0032D8C9C0
MVAYGTKQRTQTMRAQALRLLAWAAFTPVLALWPFLSTLPLVDLAAGGASAGWVAMNLFLLATGFWTVLAGWLAWRLLRPTPPAQAPGPDEASRVLAKERRGLVLGAYASVWTVVYMGVAVIA